MNNLDELLEERGRLNVRAREIRDKYKHLNLLDADNKKEVEERKKEWAIWEADFETNYYSIQEAKENL